MTGAPFRILLVFGRYSSSFTAYPWVLARDGLFVVDALAPSWHDVAWSRWLHRFVPFEGPEDFDRTLRDALIAGDYHAVLPMDDPARALVEPKLDGPGQSPTSPEADGVPLSRIASDKVRFHAWARRGGIPVPESIVAGSAEQIRAAAARLGYPVVLKEAHGSGGRNVFVLSGPDRLDGALAELGLARLEDDNPFVVQVHLPGRVGSTVIVAREGRVFAVFSVENVLRLDRGLGPAAICRVTDSPALRDLARAFAEAGRLSGLTGFDWVETEDGNPVVIDCHLGRALPTGVLAHYAGIDLGRALHASLTDGEPEPPARETGQTIWVMPQLVVAVFQGRLFEGLRKAFPLRRDVSVFWGGEGEGRLIRRLLGDYVRGRGGVLLGQWRAALRGRG